MSGHNRIHIFGASGCGATTLGKVLSERLQIKHFDSDDFFWMQTDVPYTVKRDREKRKTVLQPELERYSDWVLSGSLCSWGDFTIPMFTLAVFIYIPHELRMERIRQREIRRYGIRAISPGGWFYEHHLEFMEYVSLYDTAGTEVRSRVLHEEWMKKLPCVILRFEEPLSTEILVSKIVEHLESEAAL